jgi:hypothetical protein
MEFFTQILDKVTAPLQVSPYFVLFFIPYICASANQLLIATFIGVGIYVFASDSS